MGILYIVSTPIGNLDDITIRAQKVLSSVDTILTEDTRISGKLLKKLAISKPLQSYHDFNKEKVTPRLIEELKGERSFALITDAGTPGIADPAFYLIRKAISEQVKVIPIPGPSALITALVVSGLPTDRFIYENFLPSNSTKRKKIFEGFAQEKRTVIFYESPHRIIKVLKEMDETLEGIRVVIARELTKLHEECIRGTPKSLLEHFNTKKPKGEMVVLFNTRVKN
jgi:16S rRNA (cytidine1402-2'-O)-methyltransferase